MNNANLCKKKCSSAAISIKLHMTFYVMAFLLDVKIILQFYLLDLYISAKVQ